MVLIREDIRRIAGELLTIGFAGPTVDAELRSLVKEFKPLGLILFARNIESIEQVRELNRELKSLRPEAPLMLSVDQEGGRVERLVEPATNWPPMRTLGHIDDVNLTYRVGVALAQELRALNFDLDYAPVLDVDSNPKNPVIGDRSFSNHPGTVAKHGTALIRGLQDNGVAACGKHFPGHGDTDTDSHLALPKVEHERRRLETTEWVPFEAAIQAGVASIMTAHVVVSCLDEEHPATLSPRAMQPLRRELGFEGLLISDDLEMKAVADHYSTAEMCERGLLSGVEQFLVCKEPERVMEAYEAIVKLVESKKIKHEVLEDAAKSIKVFRDRWNHPMNEGAPLNPWSAHDSLREEIYLRLKAGS